MRKKTRIVCMVLVALFIVIALAAIPACNVVPMTPEKSSASAVVTFHGGILATPLAMPAATKPPVPYRIGTGPNTTKKVIPTFDDCPKSIQDFKEVVDYISASDYGIPLFPTGDCVKSYKKRGFDLVGYARDRGIWVLNHSISHPLLTLLSEKAVVKEISGSVVSNYGRPPYGGVDKTVRKAYRSVKSYGRHGMRIWTWTVDTEDWKALKKGSQTRPSGTTVVKRALASVKAGGTILMHMQWHGFTIKAIRALAKGLARKGLELCTAWHGEDRTGPIEATGRVVPRNIC